MTLHEFLSAETTRTRVSLAVKASLEAIRARRFTKGMSVPLEQQAEVLTAVVLDALGGALPPDGGEGEESAETDIEQQNAAAA